MKPTTCGTERMPPMHNPPHPGEALREDIVPALKLSTQDFAMRLNYPLNQLRPVLQCLAPLTIELATQLELAGLGRAGHWMAQQAAYDLWQEQQKSPQK
ncbi:HigA family addiction module antitoxin [Ectopseudomonas mendocina]|uniref:HigA family addiction module antitoxin n=1 Tax=Ectopseudomonas mendocina TaxID=300 RepID=UPI001FD16C7C|nr:HigA family addiction module antitoxin [Pseudomonas mendocina]